MKLILRELPRRFSAGKRCEGFTLIELLIVVAIIAILAAIAAPNFMEAQTRAKISRVKSDIRTIDAGIKLLYMDHNVLLVDFWDDDTAAGIDRLHNVFGRTDQKNNDRKGNVGVLVPLTTPVAYLSAIPMDPYNAPDFSHITNFQLAQEPWTYAYIDDDRRIKGDDAEASLATLAKGEYILFSPGPKQVVLVENKFRKNLNDLAYDPTNGTRSHGMVMYSSRTQYEIKTSR